MKQIKLEVGKTYVNRKGEKVKITSCDGGYYHPYQGSNGGWYAESGKRGCASKENPEDLIEEVPEINHSFGLVANALTATRYTFDIPEGVKKVTAKQEGNRIIVEMVPAKGPKPGDVMVNDRGSVYIFKGVVGSDNHEHYAWLGENGRLAIGGVCYAGRPATAEEAKPLWDALKKAGKRWNQEAMRVEDMPERERIREWVEEHLNDVYYSKQCIAKMIGYYLKYKEGEK